jgi:pyruvate,water dikinase
MLAFSVVALTRLSHYLTLAFFRFGWMSNKIKRTNSDLDVYCANFQPSEDLAVAVNKVRNWMRVVLKRFARRYFGGIFLGSFYLAVLGGLLSVRMGKKGEVLARRAIIGIIDKTGEMAIAINRLAGVARRKLKVVNIASMKRLYREDQKFNAEVDKFMNDFGHRGPAEFDVASLNWREDYDMLYSIIAAARDSSIYSVQREEVIDEILESARPYERFVLEKFLPRLEAFIPLRENGKHYYLKATAKTKDQLLLIGDRLAKEGYIEQRRDVFFLTLRDLDRVIDRRYTKKEVLAVVKQRKKQWREYQRAEVPDIIYESGERITSSVQKSNVLLGEPLSSGKIVARARIVDDFSQIRRLKQGEILVTHHADPGWTPLFTIASGLIVEVGGVICHAAMVARELGLPAISVVGATSLIRDGSIVEMDADEGRVVLR